jgi:leader peptidase (prepilin peptidase)/N-methyltransferase
VLSLVVAVVAGYAVGTLLALLLDRLYTGAPMRGPVRLCEEHALPPLAWAGAAGYLALGGRCPSGCRLPARLWYLPLLGAIAGIVIGTQAAGLRHALLLAGFSTILLAFVATDFERHLLPNRVMYPALALAVALSWAWPGRGFSSSVEGGLLGGVLMFAWFVVVPNLGFGDVKLSALLGLVSGVSYTLPALAVGIIAGGIGGGMMLATRRAGLKSTIAYGPYLALGAFVGMLMSR